MTIRKRMHYIVFETAMFSRIVCITLVVLHAGFLEDIMITSGFVASCLSAIMLLVCFLLFSNRKTRNSTAPLVFILILGITGLFCLGEAILYGLTAFNIRKANNKDGSSKPVHEVLLGAMSYAIVSLLSTILLVLLLIFWPPIYDPSQREGVVEKPPNSSIQPPGSGKNNDASQMKDSTQVKDVTQVKDPTQVKDEAAQIKNGSQMKNVSLTKGTSEQQKPRSAGVSKVASTNLESANQFDRLTKSAAACEKAKNDKN